MLGLVAGRGAGPMREVERTLPRHVTALHPLVGVVGPSPAAEHRSRTPPLESPRHAPHGLIVEL